MMVRFLFSKTLYCILLRDLTSSFLIDLNIADCGWDGGDCNSTPGSVPKSNKGDRNDFLERYPLCPDVRTNDGTVIGDSICDFISPEYMSDELCGKEDGDCADCVVDDWRNLGDGYCDGGKYNTTECNFDFGDCM